MSSRPSQDIYAETLAIFSQREDKFEPLTTPEVADALDANRRTVYKRLQNLVDQGYLNTKETGSNSRVWWQPSSAFAGPERDQTQSNTQASLNEGPNLATSNHTADVNESNANPQETSEHERRSLEETNQQLRAVLDTVEASIFIKDADGRYQLINEECREMLGLDTDAKIIGLTDEEIFPPNVAEQYRADDQRVLEHGETVKIEEEVPTPEGSQTNLTLKSPLFDTDGTPAGICAVSTDISERKERERELKARSTAMEASIDGMSILNADEEYVFVNQAHADVYGYEDPDEFLGETWRMCYDEDELDKFETDVLPALREEGAWRGEAIGKRKDGSTFPQELSLTAIDDGGLVCVVRDITDRKEDEQKLERQRGQLAALDELNNVVRGITESVIEQSTRAEIEKVVCNRLAASDSYRFAWICAIDSEAQLEPRQVAGVEGYLDDITLSIDPDDAAGQGPTGKAVRTQEMQVTQHALEDSDFEPWHDHARKYGYRSSAAIPIVHEETLYGVIGVYSERADAFAKQEREVVGQLGEVTGHAIAAVDRKRALLSEEVTEVELRVHGLDGLSFPDSDDGMVAIEQIVPVGDESYLAYGTATGEAMDTVRSLVDVETTPYVGPVDVLKSIDGETRFELRLTNPEILTTVEAHGGYVNAVRIEDRQLTIQIRLSPNTDVRTVLGSIKDEYPGTEMVSRRQTSRSTQTSQPITQILEKSLTERQRAALNAAYFAGFFEWPRHSSGEDVAASLEIDVSTFHQHLRKAEKKVLDAIIEHS